MVQYPMGIQTFSEIRRQGLQYIDKTKFIYMLAHGTQNNFLSRPSRFGKSLSASLQKNVTDWKVVE